MKVTPQQAYDSAIAHYENAKRLIASVCASCNGNYGANPDIMLMHYDLTLQSLLYRVAICDSVIYGNEKVFLQNITQKSDLVGQVNHSYNTNFTWDTIQQLNPTQQKQFSAAINDLLNITSAALILPFAALDAKAGGNANFEALCKTMLNIALCFAAVDGDDTESAAAMSEMQVAVNNFNAYLTKKWAAAVEQLK